MSSNYSTLFKKLVETLSKSNWRQVFVELKLWFESKGLFYVCLYEKNEFCALKGYQSRVQTDIETLTAAVAALHVKKEEKPDHKSQENQLGIINYERSSQWDRDSSAVMYWLRQCCPNDLDTIEDNITPKRVWNALYTKYSKVKAGDLRKLEREITAFNRESQAPGKSPEECFEMLKALRRRFLLLKPGKKESLSNEDLFGYLLDGLTEDEWKLTKDNVDAQPNLDYQEKLDILQRFFENTPVLQGMTEDEALIANSRWPRSRLRSSRKERPHIDDDVKLTNSRSRPMGYRCYQCKSEEHRVDTCPYKEPAKEWAYQQRLRDEKRQSKSYRRPSTPLKRKPSDISPQRDDRNVKFGSQQFSKRGLAFTAHDDEVEYNVDEEEYDAALQTDHEEGDIIDEGMMAFSTENIRSKQSPDWLKPVIWHPDTAASSHMTDQSQLFKSPLRPTRRTIRVGGGRLFCREMGDAWMVTKSGVALLKDCLLVPGLGANLLSVRKACMQAGLKGSFDASKMYLHKENEIILTASHDNGVYSVDSILSPKIGKENAFTSQQIPDNLMNIDCSDNLPPQDSYVNSTVNFGENNNLDGEVSQTPKQETLQIIDNQMPIWSQKEMVHRNRLDRYSLMHRRLGHAGSAALAKVHNVTNLKRPIMIPQTLPKCETCVRANIKNRFSKRLAPHKSKRLAILSVDIAGPFPISIRGNSYFVEVIDNWSRMVWILLLANKSELSKKMNELSLMLEKQSGEEILAGRSDNAPEIIKLFGEWKSKRGIVPQTTAPYNSNQNGTAERGIQSSEREARALLEDSGMPVEFWDYAVESGAYVRNRLQRGPWIEKEIDGKILHQQLSPQGAWTGIHEQDIEHLRVWGCQTIPYVDIKSMPNHARKDKLMPRGRNAVFVGYVNETTKQWLVWAPDLRRVIVVKRAEFFEDKPGGKLSLNLNMELSNGRLITGNGTQNAMPERNPRGRPAKTPIFPRQIKRTFLGVEHLAQGKMDVDLTELKEKTIQATSNEVQSTESKTISQLAVCSPTTQPIIQPTTQSTTQPTTQSTTQPNTQPIAKSIAQPPAQPILEAEPLKSPVFLSRPKGNKKVTERVSNKISSEKVKTKKGKETVVEKNKNEKAIIHCNNTNSSDEKLELPVKATQNISNKFLTKSITSPSYNMKFNDTESKTNINSYQKDLDILPSNSESPTLNVNSQPSSVNFAQKIEVPNKASRISPILTPQSFVKDLPISLPDQDPIPISRTQLNRVKFQKRKRQDYDNEYADMPQPKILKAMLAVLDKMDNEDNFDDDNAFLAEDLVGTAFNSIQVGNDIPIPVSYNQAIKDPEYGNLWRIAIDEEIQSLLENGTWREEVAPPNVNLVGTKWIFTVKYKVDGTFDRFKARLVARGFTQQYGIDYTETFAPTVQMATMRAFLSIVAAENLNCWQFDVKNAFTESEMKEVVYLKPPQGLNVTKGKSLRVLRSLYGLKQSARDWNLQLRSEMVKWGFVQSQADPCLFSHKNKGLTALVYVDDIAIAAAENKNLEWFSKTLSSRFKAKNLGEIQKILGMRITRDRSNRTLFIDQELYLDKILRKFGFEKPTHKTQKIPVEGYESLRPATEKDTRVNTSEYSMIIGSIMFAMVYTRPDIAFALGRLSQFMKDPAEHHMAALKKLLRYLRSTINYRIRFGPGGKSSLVVYSDADWASDKCDRKSVTGAVGILCGGAIFWLSRKQKSVATSTAEAEYMAMAVTAKQGQWIAQVLRDMGYPQYIAKNAITVQTKGDNQGAIHLVKNPILSERSKHIDISYHYVRDLAERKRIAVEYVPTNKMVADGMTKPLPKTSFENFVKELGIVSKDVEPTR